MVSCTFRDSRPDIVTFNSTMPSMADECRWMEAIALLQDVQMKQTLGSTWQWQFQTELNLMNSRIFWQGPYTRYHHYTWGPVFSKNLWLMVPCRWPGSTPKGPGRSSTTWVSVVGNLCWFTGKMPGVMPLHVIIYSISGFFEQVVCIYWIMHLGRCSLWMACLRQ